MAVATGKPKKYLNTQTPEGKNSLEFMHQVCEEALHKSLEKGFTTFEYFAAEVIKVSEEKSIERGQGKQLQMSISIDKGGMSMWYKNYPQMGSTTGRYMMKHLGLDESRFSRFGVESVLNPQKKKEKNNYHQAVSEADVPEFFRRKNQEDSINDDLERLGQQMTNAGDKDDINGLNITGAFIQAATTTAEVAGAVVNKITSKSPEQLLDELNSRLEKNQQRFEGVQSELNQVESEPNPFATQFFDDDEQSNPLETNQVHADFFLDTEETSSNSSHPEVDNLPETKLETDNLPETKLETQESTTTQKVSVNQSLKKLTVGISNLDNRVAKLLDEEAVGVNPEGDFNQQIQQLNAALDKIEKRLDSLESSLKKLQKVQAKLSKSAEKLKNKSKQLNELSNQLNNEVELETTHSEIGLETNQASSRQSEIENKEVKESQESQSDSAEVKDGKEVSDKQTLAEEKSPKKEKQSEEEVVTASQPETEKKQDVVVASQPETEQKQDVVVASEGVTESSNISEDTSSNNGSPSTVNRRRIFGIVFFDGASRGNPGSSAAGAVVVNTNGIETTLDKYLGKATNNQAEYEGLLLGLKKARELGIKDLVVCGDSKLIINQVRGDYKVKDPFLKSLHQQVSEELKHFDHVEIKWTQRENNQDANRVANNCLDREVGHTSVNSPESKEKGKQQNESVSSKQENSQVNSEKKDVETNPSNVEYLAMVGKFLNSLTDIEQLRQRTTNQVDSIERELFSTQEGFSASSKTLNNQVFFNVSRNGESLFEARMGSKDADVYHDALSMEVKENITKMCQKQLNRLDSVQKVDDKQKNTAKTVDVQIG